MKFNQLPHTLLMVKPASFGFNDQTAASNAFQSSDQDPLSEIQRKAVTEFTMMTEQLAAHDIDLIVFDDDEAIKKPDAVFPNNWISFHEGGEIILYPMLAVNRRNERRKEIVDMIAKDFIISEIVDLSS